MVRNLCFQVFFALLVLLWPMTGKAAVCGDFFCHLVDANRASLIMLRETRLIEPELAAALAAALADLDEAQERTSNYLDLEADLISAVGEEASRIHLGRSRQDLHGTVRRMMMRRAVLELLEAQVAVRDSFLTVAQKHATTVIPAYTHGVQAQPTTLGHLLLAYEAAMSRTAMRMQQTYARLNTSPLGAAALTTSGFPIDRRRLAQLLGFAAPVENSFDANLVSSLDYKTELAGVLMSEATQIGQFSQTLHVHYADPQPWIELERALTSGSSIMPQKANPRPLDRLRASANEVLGAGEQVFLNAHNTIAGMNEYRPIETILRASRNTLDMYVRYGQIVSNLVVHPERALDALNRGFSTMTEVADLLVRREGLPFRVAHRYAARLTRIARDGNTRASSLSDRQLVATFTEVVGRAPVISVAEVRAAMDPVRMVSARAGLGGPQPEEFSRMRRAARKALERDAQWVRTESARLVAVRQNLRQQLTPPSR